MTAIPSAGPARRRTLTPYVLLWLLMAGLSLAYLTFLGARPDVVAAWRASAKDPQKEIAETKQSVERAIADLDPVRQSVGEIKLDVANLKIGAQEASERDKTILEKVVALEQSVAAKDHVAQAPAKAPAVATVTTSVPPAAPEARKPAAKVAPLASETSAPPATQKSAAAPPKSAAAAPKEAATAPKAAAAAPKSPAAIETGSIEQPKAAAAKPPQVGVLLATGPSVDSLRLSWTILNDRSGDAVRGLQPRYVASGKGEERTYGLLAGPLASTEDAQALCKTMTERGMACEVSTYKGTAF